jgi:hypothetical protein
LKRLNIHCRQGNASDVLDDLEAYELALSDGLRVCAANGAIAKENIFSFIFSRGHGFFLSSLPYLPE